MNITQFKNELSRIKLDNKSGSIGILNQVTEATIKLLASQKVDEVTKVEMLDELSQMGSELPDFVVLGHFVEYLFSKRELEQFQLLHAVDLYVEHWGHVEERIATKIAEHLNFKDSLILLHSQTSTVQNVLMNLKTMGHDATFYQTQSNPGGEGKIQADFLRGKGFHINLIEDSKVREIISSINYCFFGADVVLNEVFINKSGTSDIAQLAHKENVPVLVLADSRKIVDKSDHNINLQQLERVSLENIKVLTEI